MKIKKNVYYNTRTQDEKQNREKKRNDLDQKWCFRRRTTHSLEQIDKQH